MQNKVESTPGTHQVLLVDDSPEDREAAVRAFKKSGLTNSVFTCEDGEDALDYLHRRGKYSDPESSPRPGVILLDLNMPGTTGKDVLEEIKKDAVLKKIPVIILTTSTDPNDIETCYSLGANTYMQKPVNLSGFVEAISLLKEYWFGIAILPKSDSTPP